MSLEQQKLTEYIDRILEDKVSNSDRCIIEIIFDYSFKYDDFDIDEFIERVKKKEMKLILSYIEDDAIKHGYIKADQKTSFQELIDNFI